MSEPPPIPPLKYISNYWRGWADLIEDDMRRQPQPIKHKVLWRDNNFAVIEATEDNPVTDCYRTVSRPDLERARNLNPSDEVNGIMLRAGITRGFVKVRVADLAMEPVNEFGKVSL